MKWSNNGFPSAPTNKFGTRSGSFGKGTLPTTSCGVVISSHSSPAISSTFKVNVLLATITDITEKIALSTRAASIHITSQAPGHADSKSENNIRALESEGIMQARIYGVKFLNSSKRDLNKGENFDITQSNNSIESKLRKKISQIPRIFRLFSHAANVVIGRSPDPTPIKRETLQRCCDLES